MPKSHVPQIAASVKRMDLTSHADLCGCSDNGEQCENVLDDDSDDDMNIEEDDHDDHDVDYDDVNDV